MKSAEEWLSEEWGVSKIQEGKYIGYVEHTGEEFINLVKQIQLDAWQSGMKDAARCIDPHEVYVGSEARVEIEHKIIHEINRTTKTS